MTRRAETSANEALVLAGAAEVTLGALTGWPYALLLADPERARKLGIRSGHRMRQWHLDLIALGGLTMLVGVAVPDLPRRIAWPLGIGAWTNANAFAVLVVRPDAKDHPVYRLAVAGSFSLVSYGWVRTVSLMLGRRRAR